MDLPIERLDIRKMASGDESLLLTECVNWDAFPPYADEIVRLLGGTVVNRIDGPDQRVWTVCISNQLFWLAYEEYPSGVSLDPQNSDASAIVPSIRRSLLEYRAKSGPTSAGV